MASYLAIQLVMTVSLLSPSMSGNVRIRWKLSSGQYGVLSRQCRAKFEPAENIIIWSIQCPISSTSGKVRTRWKISSGQYCVLFSSLHCLATSDRLKKPRLYRTDGVFPQPSKSGSVRIRWRAKAGVLRLAAFESAEKEQAGVTVSLH